MATLRNTLLEALRLKALPRAGWLRAGVPAPESVAGHSWGVAWLVLVLAGDDVDREKALAMAIIHDLAEVRTGDITPHDGVAPADKRAAEDAAFADLVAPLPTAERLAELWRELTSRGSPEARLVHACDKLDMALQATLYAGDHPVDTEEFVRSAFERLDDEARQELWDPLFEPVPPEP